MLMYDLHAMSGPVVAVIAPFVTMQQKKCGKFKALWSCINKQRGHFDLWRFLYESLMRKIRRQVSFCVEHPIRRIQLS